MSLRATACRRSQCGFSLIELMISLVISLFMLAVVAQLFITNKAVYTQNNSLARLQENGRFAMEFLVRDLRQADFWGCSGGSTLNDRLNNSTAAGIDLTTTVQGQNATGPAIPVGIVASDQITISGAFGTSAQLQANMPTVEAPIQVIGGTNFNNGDIAIISDCEEADLFKITDATTPGVLVHAAGGGVDDNADNRLSKVYDSAAHVYQGGTVVYSINDPGGGAEPQLQRNGQVMVEGVENMQLLFGEDLDGTLSAPPNSQLTADVYIPADQVGDWDNVISVMVNLLVRSREQINEAPIPVNFNGVTVGNPGDTRSRRVFSTTVALRNR